MEAPGADQKVFRLHPLPHPHGSHENEKGGLLHVRQAGRGALCGDGDSELHGPHLAAEKGRCEARGIQRVLSGEVPRFRGPPAGHHRVRRGRRDLQGVTVHPRRHPLRLLHQGIRKGLAALFQRRSHYGQVPGSAAGALPVRPGRGGFPGSEPEHLPGAFTA